MAIKRVGTLGKDVLYFVESEVRYSTKLQRCAKQETKEIKTHQNTETPSNSNKHIVALPPMMEVKHMFDDLVDCKRILRETAIMTRWDSRKNDCEYRLLRALHVLFLAGSVILTSCRFMTSLSRILNYSIIELLEPNIMPL